jgi:hypothetical protein
MAVAKRESQRPSPLRWAATRSDSGGEGPAGLESSTGSTAIRDAVLTQVVVWLRPPFLAVSRARSSGPTQLSRSGLGRHPGRDCSRPQRVATAIASVVQEQSRIAGLFAVPRATVSDHETPATDEKGASSPTVGSQCCLPLKLKRRRARRSGKAGQSRPLGLRPRAAVNTGRVLSERPRRFPQVLPDDEGGLRRETHRTAISGDTGEHRQAAVEGDGR